MNRNFRINEKMSDKVVNEMEDYLSDAGIDYEVRSVHCKCIHCGMFTMFTSNLGATPFEDGYHCDNPDCENNFSVPDDGGDWKLNGFEWVY